MRINRRNFLKTSGTAILAGISTEKDMDLFLYIIERRMILV
jgi:hypothetical protein